MILDKIAKNDCSGCSSCVSRCSKDALTMQEDNLGFLYPMLNASKCVHCNLCDGACPVLNNKDNNEIVQIYAATNIDKKIRISSSSGGVFSALALFILEQGGVVFGAAFTDDFKHVRHIGITSSKDLAKLRTSKYVQSEIGNSYKVAKKYLDQGRIVLFTGTPCQISGLVLFLKKDYNNLYTQDIVCHGVPSPKLWKKYLEQENKDIKSINMRSKRYGWRYYSLRIEYCNQHIVHSSVQDNVFLRFFRSNVCLRESCYQCHFKKGNRLSDLTLGDYWGCEGLYPDLDDDTGMSSVLIRTQKGSVLFKKVSNSLMVRDADYEHFVKNNSSLVDATPRPLARSYFEIDIDKFNLKRLSKQYLPHQGVVKQLLRKIKLFLLARTQNKKLKED